MQFTAVTSERSQSKIFEAERFFDAGRISYDFCYSIKQSIDLYEGNDFIGVVKYEDDEI